MDISPRMSTIYRIDAEDKISSVGGAWIAFAIENFAPELTANIIGTKIWDYVYGDNVVELNREIVAQVRRSHATATYPFRCDAPHRRRDMEMLIRPLAHEAVEFESWILREIPRTAVTFFDRTAMRTNELVTVCAWCRKVLLSEWVEADIAATRNEWFSKDAVPGISHGICPHCLESLNLRNISSRSANESHP